MGQSGPNLRLGEDYALIFSKVMASFGLNEQQVLEDRVRIYGQDKIQKERILRAFNTSQRIRWIVMVK